MCLPPPQKKNWQTGAKNCKNGKSGKKRQKWQKCQKVAKGGKKWQKVAKSGKKWQKMTKSGKKWEKVVESGNSGKHWQKLVKIGKKWQKKTKIKLAVFSNVHLLRPYWGYVWSIIGPFLAISTIYLLLDAWNGSNFFSRIMHTK